jgi:release factor glutamine methyltransferase
LRPEEDTARTWTVAELLGWTESYFRKLGLPTPRLDAELLLASALGGGRLRLYTDYHKPVEPLERVRFRELVQRRARKEPVAYITGVKEFYSLRLTVSPAVLIPRPETEHLVEAAIDFLKPLAEREAPPRVLDLGTGSGNIAVSIAHEVPRARVDAVDVSSEALALARRNAVDHGVAERVRFWCGDLFAALPAAPEVPRYDVVVSNPPYVAASEIDGLMADVRSFEPRQALLDSKSASGNGLGFYRAIAADAPTHLDPLGSVLVEVGDGQAREVERIFSDHGLGRTRRIKDYAGIERVVTAEHAERAERLERPERGDFASP